MTIAADELLDASTEVPGRTALAVRLIHASDNKPVADATIVEAKTNMGPAGMAEMSGKVSGAPPNQAGLYRFLIETGMAGKWELVLTAKLSGETGPVTGRVIYDAK